MRDTVASRRRALFAPAAILASIVILNVGAHYRLIPTTAELFGLLTRYLRSASPFTVAVVSLLENIVGLTVYFPGSVVILVTMASTRGDASRATLIFCAIAVGAAIAQHFDFFLGRWIRGAHAGTSRLRGRDFAGAALAYWHPQLGSVYSAQKGADGTTYHAFVTVLATIWFPWNVFWGVLMYTVGALPVTDQQWDFVFTAYVVIWFAWESGKYLRQKT